MRYNYSMKLKTTLQITMLVFFFSTTFALSEGIEMDAANNLWRSQYDFEKQDRDYGTYNGYDDYNTKHPDGDHYYCINGIVKIKTPSGIWLNYSENGIKPVKCGDRLYNNKVRKWMGLN